MRPQGETFWNTAIVEPLQFTAPLACVDAGLVRKEGLEPSWVTPPDPKSGASALYRLKIQRLEKVEKHEWQF